jgi:menaquinone-dependent protoporphyrinogen oxidase
MGGTAGLAEMVAAAFARRGIETDLVPAAEAGSISPYDLVVVGGALYANRWHRDARRFVARHARELRTVPVWLFSSGPLGDTERPADIPAVRQVDALSRRISARGHVTFGGCLRPDAPGFIARRMAATLGGDWRDPEEVDRWVAGIVAELAGPPAPAPSPAVVRDARRRRSSPPAPAPI